MKIVMCEILTSLTAISSPESTLTAVETFPNWPFPEKNIFKELSSFHHDVLKIIVRLTRSGPSQMDELQASPFDEAQTWSTVH